MSDERLLILEMLRDGKISVEEAEKLLASVESGKSDTDDAGEKGAAADSSQKEREPWEELGEVFEKFGTDMEGFFKEFGDSLHGRIGHKWASKMENWAENFGDSLKDLSKDWSKIAGEAAQQFCDSVGVDSEIIINIDGRREKVEDTWQWEQEITDLQDIECVNIKGSITVTGWSEEKVSITAHREVQALTKEKGEEILSRLSIQPEVTDKHLFIKACTDSEAMDKAVTIHYSINVPQHSFLGLQQMKGAIRIEGVEGGATVSNQRGDVNIQQLKGPLKIQATKGDVVLENVTGDSTLQVTKGDLNVNGLQGDCFVNLMKGDLFAKGLQGKLKSRSAMGDVTVKDLDGDANIVTAKGDITCQVNQASNLELTANHGDQTISFNPLAQGEYSFLAHHGSMDIVLTDDVSADFDIQVVRGDIQSNLFEVTQSRLPFSLSKKIGDGQAKVKINIMKGDLRLVKQQSDTESTGDTNSS